MQKLIGNWMTEKSIEIDICTNHEHSFFLNGDAFGSGSVKVMLDGTQYFCFRAETSEDELLEIANKIIAFPPKDNADKFYIIREKEGKVLLSIDSKKPHYFPIVEVSPNI